MNLSNPWKIDVVEHSDWLVLFQILANVAVQYINNSLHLSRKYAGIQSSLLYVFVLFLGLDPAQNRMVVYSVLRNQPIETCRLRNSCIVYERKTKDCAGSRTFQHKS